VINNVDDGLLISLAVTCDQHYGNVVRLGTRTCDTHCS